MVHVCQVDFSGGAHTMVVGLKMLAHSECKQQKVE